MTDENNQIKFFLYENWARTKTGQHTVTIPLPGRPWFAFNFKHIYTSVIILIETAHVLTNTYK